MKLYKLIIFDLKNGIWAKKTVYLAVVAIGLLVFLDFSAHYHACYGENVFSGNLTLRLFQSLCKLKNTDIRYVN